MSDIERARERRDRRRAAQPVGAFGPGRQRREAIDNVMLRVERVAASADIDAGRKPPSPERITMALNIAGLYGPGVDAALDVEEPAVDQWEAGEVVPTAAQVQALARLTGFPREFFYLPPPDPLGPVFLCGEKGCEVVTPR